MRRISVGENASLGDFRKYPGCLLLLSCSACAWAKMYRPERIIDRLRERRAGGHATPVRDAARHVQIVCPGCRGASWGTQLVYPPDLDAREAKRLANLYRN